MQCVLEGAVLRVSGEVLNPSLPDLKQQLEGLLTQQEAALQVDLAGVESIDTAGLQVLLAARTSALRSNRNLHLCNASEVVQHTLNRTGLGFLQTPPDS